jgi:hypothetical protein
MAQLGLQEQMALMAQQDLQEPTALMELQDRLVLLENQTLVHSY